MTGIERTTGWGGGMDGWKRDKLTDTPKTGKIHTDHRRKEKGTWNRRSKDGGKRNE